MSYLTIRDQIALDLAEVTDIGKIFKWIRSVRWWDEFFRVFGREGRLEVWEITRVGSSDDVAAVQGQGATLPLNHVQHNIRIFGHMAVKEDDTNPTELTFQDRIDDVQEKFRNTQLTTSSGTKLLIIPTTLKVESIGHATWGDVFTHECEMSLLCEERVGG